jgi:hypothetical protein
MDVQTKSQPKKLLTTTQYALELARSGTPVVQGTQGICWVRHETYAMLRVPTFHLAPPSPAEVRHVLWHGPAAAVGYLLEPDEHHPPNAWLYVCTDRAYALEKCAPAMRRNVRRGRQELKIAPITADQVLAYGFQACRDSVRRLGLRDITLAEFRRQITLRARCPAHVFLGAWKDGQLAAFLSVTEVKEWADIDGCFSMDALLNLRPNDTLFFYALSHYLREETCRAVSYGVSSLQAVSNADGLHLFKTKVGFEARPVHRVFVLHPVLRPFANRLLLGSINSVLRFSPRARMLKKAEGVLASMLGERRMPAVVKGYKE